MNINSYNYNNVANQTQPSTTSTSNVAGSSFAEILQAQVLQEVEKPKEVEKTQEVGPTKDYLNMSWKEIDNLGYEEFKNNANDISTNLKNNTSTDEGGGVSHFDISTKLQAVNLTDDNTTNKDVFDSLNSLSSLEKLSFMTGLQSDMYNKFHGLPLGVVTIGHDAVLNPLTKEQRSSIEFESFISELIEAYKGLGDYGKKSLEMLAILQNNIFGLDNKENPYA